MALSMTVRHCHYNDNHKIVTYDILLNTVKPVYKDRSMEQKRQSLETGGLYMQVREIICRLQF